MDKKNQKNLIEFLLTGSSDSVMLMGVIDAVGTKPKDDRMTVETSNLKFKPKYKVISEDLRSRIISGRYEVSQPLPSQQELMSRYNVSLSTIRQSLGDLIRDGLVKPKHGKGFFVSRPEDSEDGRLNQRNMNFGFALFCDRPSDPVYTLILNGAASVLKQHGRDVILRVFKSSLMGSGHDGTMAEFANGLDRLIIAGDDIQPSLLGSLVGSEKRIVVASHVFQETAEEKYFSRIVSDARSASYLAVQLLLANGHRRIGLVNGCDSWYFAEIRVGFETACDEAEINSPEVFEVSCYQEEQAVAEEISRKHDLTGIVVTGDQHACRMIHFLGQNGCRVPENKSIVSIGGLPREDLTIPNLSRINACCERHGEEAAKMILGDSDSVVHKVLPVRLEKGNTVSKPNNGKS